MKTFEVKRSEHDVFDAGQTVRDWPENLDPGDRHLFEQSRKYEWPAGRIDTFRNLIADKHGDLFDAAQILEASFPALSIYNSRRKLKYLSRGVRARLQIERSILGERLWITDHWSRNYFHWLCDALPRLELAMSTHTEFRNGATLLLPPQFREWEVAQATLALYPGLKCEFYSELGRSARIEKLVIPQKTSLTANFNEPLIRLVASRLKDGLVNCDRSTGPQQKVYISRAQVGMRKVLNEDEMTGIFQDEGVTSHIFENYDFAQQATIMRNSEVLVAPHGAGLTNMLFMEPGSLIVEIFAAGGPIVPCYYALAHALGHRYRYVLGTPEFEGQDPHSGNIRVPLDALKRAFD